MEQTQLETGVAPVERPRDEQGRLLVSHMSDRELLEEAVTTFRFISDAFLQFQESPMMKNAMRMLGNGRR